MPKLTDFAEEYCRQRSIRKTPLHCACRFAREMQVESVREITPELLTRFRERCGRLGYSPWTVEKTITDVITLVHAATGKRLSPGKRLRKPRPQPEPVPLAAIEAIWDHLAGWMRQWAVLAYWTGARLGDAIRLLESLDGSERELLCLTASKTRHVHQWPVPQWLRPWTTHAGHTFARCRVNAAKEVRLALAQACRKTGVDVVCPKSFRQRAITEWSRANGTAGQILHGCGLGVLSHYLDPLSVLEAAAPAVRLPTCFGGTVDTGERLTQAYRRLDPQGRELVLHTCERLAR